MHKTQTNIKLKANFFEVFQLYDRVPTPSTLAVCAYGERHLCSSVVLITEPQRELCALPRSRLTLFLSSRGHALNPQTLADGCERLTIHPQSVGFETHTNVLAKEPSRPQCCPIGQQRIRNHIHTRLYPREDIQQRSKIHKPWANHD